MVASAESLRSAQSLVRQRATGRPRLAFDRVLLVIPPSIFLLDERVFQSLGILKVAAVLEQAGVAVEMLDLNGITNYLEAAEACFASTRALAIGITATTPQLPAVSKLVGVARRCAPDARLILGGPHATLTHVAAKSEHKQGRVGRAHRALAHLSSLFDVLVSGDGEDAIFVALGEELVAIVDADDPKSGMFMSDESYEASPWPARHLIDIDSYHYSIDGHRALSVISQLGCPFRCAFSVTGDTVVFVDGAPVAIAELASGVGSVKACAHGHPMLEYRIDRAIAGPDGPTRATRAVAEGMRPVLRVTVEGGLCIKATAEHRFLVVEDERVLWRRADELRSGTFMVVRRPDRQWPDTYEPLRPPVLPEIPPGGFPRRRQRMPTHLDEKLAWLAGFVVGDGSIPKDGRPSFHICITPEIEARAKAIVRECFGVEIAISRASNTDTMMHGWVHSRMAREVFVQSIGIDPEDKHKIPSILWRSPRAVLSAFLDGLFAADAYVNDEVEYLVTAEKRLANDVAYALLMLGRGCPTIRRVEPVANALPGSRGSYRVGVLANDRIPSRKALYRSSKSGVWYWRTPRDPTRFKGVRRRTLHESKLHHPLDRDGWYYAQVRSVAPCLTEPVFDLTVPGEEAFVANGFVAHNCAGRSSNMLRRIRTRSTASVIAELEHVYRTYGITGAMLHDDELNVNKDVVGLMDAIAALGQRLGIEWRLRGFVKAELFTDEQARAMYRAGFRWLLCGFEAAHPRILENIEKVATLGDNTRVVETCHRHGLKIKALMSVGHAGETEQSVRAVRDWLISVAPDDFDCTIITAYPGCPYYDRAVPHASMPDVWTFTAKKSGDRLHCYDLDYTRVADYYKGDPEGGYTSYVFTDELSPERIVELRDGVERDVRARLSIPFNASAAARRYEHSMGQGDLPPFILRRSEANPR